MLRIWDCLFNEGSKIIFRVALTLIKQHQAFILEATSVVDICERFKAITRGSFVTECHTFMQVRVWGSVAWGELFCLAPPLWASVGPSGHVAPPPPGVPRQWLPLLLGCPMMGSRVAGIPVGPAQVPWVGAQSLLIRCPLGALPLLLVSLVLDDYPWPHWGRTVCCLSAPKGQRPQQGPGSGMAV